MKRKTKKKQVTQQATSKGNAQTNPSDIQLKDLESRLAALIFNSSDPIVIAINGRWGEGKTFFWKKVVEDNGVVGNVGYVSVFGANSVTQIRERVVFEALRHTPITTNTKLAKQLDQIWQYILSKSGPFYKYLSFTGSFIKNAFKRWPEYISAIFRPNHLSIQLLEENLLKPQWIICLDDIERLSESVELDELLGYINELRNERNLKVVLIGSYDDLGEKTTVFQNYKEKVIDRELPFTPDTADIINFVFGKELNLDKNQALKKTLVKKCNVLGLRNIRILFKAKRYYQEIVEELPINTDPNFLQDKLFSLLLYVYASYSKNDDEFLNINSLSNYNEISMAFARINSKEDSSAQQLSDLLKDYGYSNTDDIDKLLIQFVQTDTIDKEQLNNEYLNLTIETSKIRLSENFSGVWQKYYHGTLTNNVDDFVNELRETTLAYIEFIPLNNLNESLTCLSKLGKGEFALEILERYKVLNVNSQESGVKDRLISPITFDPLNDFIMEIEENSKIDERNLEELISSFLTDNYLNSRDKLRFSKFSVSEIVEYLISSDIPKVTNLMRQLRKDGLTVMDEVAEEIKSLSGINKMRMESMGFLKRDED